MKRAFHALLVSGLALGASLAGSALIADPQDPPAFPSDTELRARYALPTSHFVTIGGETVHYSDEGTGPAILLLHGSYASLRQWDDWAKELRKSYRVIRFDKSPAGLSGPSPTGDYTVAHQIAEIDALMDKLGIDRFVIVGTSSAGLPAAAYAAARPQRTKAVILANIAAGKISFDLSTMPQALRDAVAADAKHPSWHSEEFWKQIMLANVVDKTVVTPALVTRWTDLNQRALRDPDIGTKAAAASDFSRTPDDLAKITAPTLLLWSDQDHETSFETHGVKAFNLLATKDKTLTVVPDCGHMMPLDCPARSLERVLPFLKRISAR